MDGIDVRAGGRADAGYVRRALVELMAGTSVAGHGELIDAMALPVLVAWIGDEPVGHVTYRVDPERGWELDQAQRAGAARVWLVTTNDNTGALRFYQRRGFDLIALDRDAVTRAREHLKPAIPTDNDGIAIRHELELEWRPGDPL